MSMNTWLPSPHALKSRGLPDSDEQSPLRFAISCTQAVRKNSSRDAGFRKALPSARPSSTSIRITRARPRALVRRPPCGAISVPLVPGT